MGMQSHYATLDAIRQAIFVVEADPPDYPITFVNAALSTLTGYQAQELLGKGCAMLFGRPDDPAGARQQLASALQPPPAEPAKAPAREARPPRLLSVSEVWESEQCYYIAVVGEHEAGAQAPTDMAKLAHELRGPLSACVAWIDLLELKAGSSPEIADAVAAIKRNLARQSRVIDELVNRFGAAG